VTNLHELPVSEAISVRADFYRQTRHLVPGQRVKIEVPDEQDAEPRD
jgi:hypothetical protein